MKIKAILATACLVATSGMASAFTFSVFANQIATNITSTPTIYNVPGYGNISLVSGGGNLTYSVSPSGTGSFRFDAGETLFISFQALPVWNFDYSASGLAGGEFFDVTTLNPGTEFAVSFTGTEAGLNSISYIPEPSSSILGVLGVSLLALRRKR